MKTSIVSNETSSGDSSTQSMKSTAAVVTAGEAWSSDALEGPIEPSGSTAEQAHDGPLETSDGADESGS